MNEEERDLEAELKEEKDRYERQNQEAYDEVTKGNEELRRRQEAAYEKNRQKLKKTREESADPDRFKSQLETIQKFTPDPMDPKEVSEFLTDMAVDAGILGRSLGEDLPAGIALVISRRLAKNKNVQNIVQDGLGKVAETVDDIVEPDNGLNILKQIRAVYTGELFGVTGGTFPTKKTGKLKKVAPTTTRDLGLYGATDDMFEDLQTTSLNTALEGGSKRGGRFVKLQNATTGQPEYYTVFTRGGKTQILPYNTWYQKNVNPFMVPKKLLETWRKSEGGQQLNLFNISTKNPFGAPVLDIPYGTKGKTRQVVAKTRYPKGTVDEFNNWYKGVFKLQKEEQALNRQVSIMLERLGNIEARNPGKKVFDTDLSHIAPRSKGGSGLTFQEAWILNQGRGADDILDPELLAAAGIPRNWDELFNYWLMQKKQGREFQTAIGPLEHINVDDYFALSKGEPLSIVGRRRQNIRNLVERQIGDFETHTFPGAKAGNDIGDDFTELVRKSKEAQPGGATYMINQNLLDLRYVADNYEDLLDLGEI